MAAAPRRRDGGPRSVPESVPRRHRSPGCCVTAPLEVTGAAAAADPEAAAHGAGKAIEGRSLGQIAWMRLKRDKVAMAGGVVVIFLIVCRGLRPAHRAASSDIRRTSSTRSRSTRTCRSPSARSAASSWDFLFGVEPVNGRDIFSRVVYGARISLLIAFLATLLSVAHRHRARRDRRLLRRLGRHRDQPADGHLPRLPAAGLRDRAGRGDPGPGLRPLRATRCASRC